uniref:Centrosomal protein 43 n=1 Tax=Homo sapiens TaxID=9606 RepID=A0A994J500_HUMAN
MAATAAAVVAEEDTELRDLLVQTLENSGVLNRIKAELRAAVFLALEEQEKVENKTPLVNESLKKFLNTKDGRLVASLVAEFLQFFNLDFTLAVFQPETSTLQGLEGRENLARDLGIIEAEGTVGGPLLLEVIRRCQQKEKGPTTGEGALDLSDVHSPPKSPEGKTSAQTTPSKIPRYKGQGKKKTSGQKAGDKARMLPQLLGNLFPCTFLILFLNCLVRSLYCTPCGLLPALLIWKANDEANQSDTSVSLSEPKSKSSLHLLSHETKIGSFLSNRTLDGKDKAGLCPDEDDMEGDSFFDDPIPKPEKTYGLRKEPRKQAGSLASLSDAPPLKSGLSSLAGAPSLKDSESKRGNTVLKDLKLISDKIGSLGLGTGEDDDYVDDFNSTSHRSEKSEISIGEEIEEDLSVEIDDINTSDKLDDLTQDLTVSQLSDVADYLEDVA